MATRTYLERAIQITTRFTVWDCGTCGVLYGVTEDFEQRRRADGQTFYCPNGHGTHFHETEALRLRRQLDQAQAEAGQFRRERDRLANDLLDKVKEQRRLTRRIHAGVCPHCNRTFQQLARHMASKHPDAK